MGIFVVSKLLFLLSNIYSYLYCLLDISNGSVQLKSPLWFFGLIINLPEQIINQFVSESFNFDFSHHFNHIRDHLFSFSNIELQSLVVLLTLLVMFGSPSPLRLALIVLSDSQMFI